MTDLAPLADMVGSLLGPAVKAAFRTTVATVVLTLLVSGACLLVATPGGAWHAALAAGIALALCGIVAAVLVVKRAIFAAVQSGVEKLGLGRRVLDLVIARMLGIGDDAPFQRRGPSAVKVAERLPLAQAEARLRSVVASLAAHAPGGWLARRIESSLLGHVEKITLARFRDVTRAHGGVDVLRVREELGGDLDGLLVSTLDAVTLKLTVGLAGGAVVLSLLSAYLLRVP